MPGFPGGNEKRYRGVPDTVFVLVVYLKKLSDGVSLPRPGFVAVAQVLSHLDSLAGNFALSFNTGPVILMLSGGFPVEQFGFGVVDANGFVAGLRKSMFQNSIGFGLRGTIYMVVLPVQQVDDRKTIHGFRMIR